VPAQCMEAALHLGPRKILDERPGRVRVRATAGQHEAGATGDARAGAIGSGQRHRSPLVREVWRRPAAELADVPGPREVEGVESAEELVPDVGDLRLRQHRRPALFEHARVEGERVAETGAAEIAAGPALAQ